jgi:hypothetical protein
MDSNHVAGLVLATALWMGLAACAIVGGSIRPDGEFWEHELAEGREPSDARARRPSGYRGGRAGPAGGCEPRDGRGARDVAGANGE